MSGFLHRILAQVKAPAIAIYPRVRPLYGSAAETAPAAAPDPLVERITTAAEALPFPGERSAQQAPSAPTPHPRQRRAGEELPSHSGEHHAPDSAAEFAEPRRTATLIPEPSPARDAAADRISMPDWAEEGTLLATARVAASDDMAPPPVGAAAPPPRAAAVPRASQSSPPMPRRRRANPVSDSTAAAAAPADEIQIHIGRIEITAVPPAPAPRAASVKPRGMSLDQYLQRGGPR